MTGLSKTKPLQHTFIKCFFLLFLGRVDKCWFTKGWFRFIVSKNRHLDSCSGDNTKHNYYGCTSVKSITSRLHWNCFRKSMFSNPAALVAVFAKKVTHQCSLNSTPQCLKQWLYDIGASRASFLYTRETFLCLALDFCILVLIVLIHIWIKKLSMLMLMMAVMTLIEIQTWTYQL